MQAINRKPLHAAFSLTELLVVSATIAALIALIVPVISGARERSASATCLANLRQLGLAAASYQAEHQGIMTPYFGSGDGVPNWMVALNSYAPTARSADFAAVRGGLVPSVFSCPARATKTPNLATYGMNPAVLNEKWDRVALRIPSPSAIIYFSEMQERNTEWVLTSDGLNPNTGRASGGSPMALRHAAGSCNVVYCDGHAELLGAAQLTLTRADGSSLWRWW